MLSCDTVNAVEKADCSNDKVVNKIQEKVMALSGRGTDYQVPLWDLTRAHNTRSIGPAAGRAHLGDLQCCDSVTCTSLPEQADAPPPSPPRANLQNQEPLQVLRYKPLAPGVSGYHNGFHAEEVKAPWGCVQRCSHTNDDGAQERSGGGAVLDSNLTHTSQGRPGSSSV